MPFSLHPFSPYHKRLSSIQSVLVLVGFRFFSHYVIGRHFILVTIHHFIIMLVWLESHGQRVMETKITLDKCEYKGLLPV